MYVHSSRTKQFAECTESTSRLQHRVQHDERIPKLVKKKSQLFFFFFFFEFLNFSNFCPDFGFGFRNRIFKNLRAVFDPKRVHSDHLS